MTDAGPKHDGAPDEASVNPRKAMAFWRDRQHRELLFYLSVTILFLELVVGAVAFFYGVVHAEPGVDGGPPRFRFPWPAYSLAAVLAPAALLLIVHLTGAGLFRSLRRQEDDEVWRRDLPDRLRKVYAVVQGAPTVVLLLGILLLGAAFFYIDGAMNALLRLAGAAERHLPQIVLGAAAAWCVGYTVRAWFRYRTRRMEAEFLFRREVLERTGVIIVDRHSMRLPPAMPDAGGPHALESGAGAAPCSAAPAEGSGPVLDVTPPIPGGEKTRP